MDQVPPAADLDHRPPVVVGVGQVSERLDDPATGAVRPSIWPPTRPGRRSPTLVRTWPR
jgi:hypothetical protein